MKIPGDSKSTRKRAFSSHIRWKTHEIEVLQSIYADSDWGIILNKLPGRSVSQIQNKAYLLGILRKRPDKLSPDEIRERKREHMAKRREANPEAVREYQRQHFKKNQSAVLQKNRDYLERRFFWSRSMKLKGPGRANASDLAKLWIKQRGRCALTGRKMDETAQVDHILAKAKGGKDDLSNLRWTCKEANLAKRELSDADFIKLCREVCNHHNV